MNAQDFVQRNDQERKDCRKVAIIVLNWNLYIARIPPLKYDKIVLQINDENWDIEGYHEIRLDYVLFADWTPSQVWSSYYVRGSNT